MKKLQTQTNNFFERIRSLIIEPLITIADTFNERTATEAEKEIQKDRPNL